MRQSRGLARYLFRFYWLGLELTPFEVEVLRWLDGDFPKSVEMRAYHFKKACSLGRAVEPDKFRIFQANPDDLLTAIAKRFETTHPEVFRLNYCPKCGELTRTPTAGQCPYCFHQWHEDGGSE